MNPSHPTPEGHPLQRLREIIERLRAPDGCPWDREQTISTIRKNFLEEGCELIDAVDDAADEAHASAEVCEELGDVLMNIFLAARIAEEAGGFDLDRVAEGICEKLIRRHPHVFGSEKIEDVNELLERWESIKASEKPGSGRRSILDKVPRSLPSLVAAQEIGQRAGRVGFDWEQPEGALEKIREELAEVEACLRAEPAASDRIGEEIGDLLFAVVNLSRKVDISAEEALQAANRKFRRRFAHVEQRLGLAASDADTEAEAARPSIEEMERVWREAKELE